MMYLFRLFIYLQLFERQQEKDMKDEIGAL